MALFKTFRGKRADLGAQELRDGFAYFCTDDGTFHIDFLDTDGQVKRKQINAKDAETLLGHSIEEFLIASENGSFAHGEGSAATGTNSYAGGQEALAFGNAAHAEGYKTLAGGKGFKIIGFEDNGNGTGKYTLSSVTGLETEMRYSAVLSSANYNAGKIIEIVGNVVTVDGYKDIEFNSNADNADEFNVYNFLMIVDRPDLGDREVGFNAHTEGENTIASNKATHAEGRNTKAIGKFAHAEGSNTIAGHGAHAEGSGSQALGDISHAEGNRTKATGNYSHTEGNNTVASAQGTHAEGIKAQAIYNAAHAEGQNTLADGLAAHAEGESTIAKFTGSHAEGVSTQAIEETAHAEGYNTQATAKAAHAEGENTVASAKRAHAEGYSTSASELNAHAEGKLTTASAEEAHAEGISTIASGAYSHTEGNTTQALSEAAHAEGKETIAQGIGAHAEGSKSRALNNTAHAEGSNTEASGEKSHAEGNATKATGTASHAEGDKTEAKGYASHAGGQSSIASNAGSFVHGTGLKTNSNNQAVVGAYNKTFEGQSAAFIVGNGKEDARSNAFAVMKSGDAYLKGDLYVGGLPEGDVGVGIAKVATEEEAHSYADSAANNAATKVKNELLNGAGDAYDTLRELGDLIEENKDAFEVVTDLVNNKADQNDVSNAFKKTVSTTAGGQFLTITDHSPIPHMMRLIGKDNLHSSEVHQYGKNILNIESFLGGALVQKEDGTYDLRYSNGNTYVSAWNYQYIPPETVITISLEVLDYVDIADGNLKLQIQTSGGNHWLDFPVSTIGRQSKTITTKGNVNQMQFMIASSNGKSAGIVFKEPQFELGATATEYVAYQTAYYDAPATGVDVPAFYPVTTFITDWGLIDCTYNQDINNIFDDTNYMSATDPVGTGSFSMNRKAGTTVGVYSHAEGNNTTASGRSSHAEGNHTTASNISAHAEGSATVASGFDSHAEGQNTTASGQDAHAEGYYTSAEELGAHAGGLYSHAKTKGSFVHGRYLNATADNQFVVGQYNKEDPGALFIVGGGDSEENRKNLFTVKKDGSIIGLNTSNALTKTVSGEAISATDASPIEHEMDVKVQGKNLLDVSTAMLISNAQTTQVTYERTDTGIKATLPAALGYYARVGYRIGSTEEMRGKTFTISYGNCVLSDIAKVGNIRVILFKTEGYVGGDEGKRFITIGGNSAGQSSFTFTIPQDANTEYMHVGFLLGISEVKDIVAGASVEWRNIQVEEGATATAYAPYIEDISTVKVKKYGKNLFKATTEQKVLKGITADRQEDGSYHIYGTSDGTGDFWMDMNITLPRGKYTGSGCPTGGSSTTYFIEYHNRTTGKGKIDYGTGATFETAETNTIVVHMVVKSGQTVDLIFKPMIEVGAGDKVYEPYIEPIEYPVSADGIVDGVTPIYPTTTLVTDTAGVVIDCTYNRDINRVLDDTGFMYDHNPSGTGSFSMNRKVGSEIGAYSHTEGYSSAATGRASHAGGEATQAKGIGAFAHGQRVTADADYQATFGTHNEVNTNAALIVGNGVNSTSKNNAFEVQKDGNAFVKGDLYIGGTGSTQASAKQVATKDSLSAMEQRINNLEDITSSTGGVFFEDADVAYVKTIPENIAPYASLNKVGGMGIYKKKLANLIPSTYETANGTVSGYHTFNSNADGVITIVDRTPVEEWTSEPWFSAEISLNTIELPAGTYTATIYADNPEGSPFGLCISGVSEDIHVGGAWGYDYVESPVTFTLTETTTIWTSLKFDCGGSAWVPTGDTEVCHFRVMLNEGEEAMPWEPYSGAGVEYIEPAKATSVDIIGKNLFDYGTSRTIHTGEPGYAETNMMITDNGTAYIENMYIPIEVGPGSEYGTIMSAWIEDVNSTITYPAGVYSVGDPVPHTNGEAYLVIYAKTINTQQNITIQGNNNVIAEPFTIRNASIDYAPAELTSRIYGIEVPLMLVKGTQTPAEPLPFKRSTIQIPSQIISRDDYGLGVYDTYNYELYNNYIDFERQKYIKRCLTQDLVGEVTGFATHGTKINPGVMYSTIRCSDPNITFDFYQPGPGAYELRAYKEGWDSSMVNEYIQNAMEAGTPIKVFFGTNLTEEIDISAELAGIDNYIPVEAGGLIYFNNDRQEAVPSTIEYQSMMKKGEIEEL